MVREDFVERDQFEETEEGFSAAPLEMEPDEIIEAEEEEMGFFGKKEIAEEEIMEEAEVEEKPAKKKPARKSGMRPYLYMGILSLVLGGVYFAWDMMNTQAAPQYLPPVQTQAKAPAVKRKAPAKTLPDALPVKEMAEASSAVEVAALETVSGNGPIEIAYATQESQKPVPVQKAPSSPETFEQMEQIKTGIMQLAVSLEEMRLLLMNMGAPQKSDVPKETLKEMTAEIQALTAKNRSLSEELSKAQTTLASLRDTKKPVKKPVKTPERKEAKTTESGSGNIDSWEILGFSGNRVVIADDLGTHSVNVGGTYGGVKILSVDVEGGTVRTSAGLLKYAR